MEVNLKFRRAEESDWPFLLALRSESMNSHIINAGLIPTEANHLERIKYRFEYAKIIICNSIEIGLLKVVKEGPVWDLVQIQLNSSYRGLGLGKSIINGVLKEAFSQNVSRVRNCVIAQFQSDYTHSRYWRDSLIGGGT